MPGLQSHGMGAVTTDRPGATRLARRSDKCAHVPALVNRTTGRKRTTVKVRSTSPTRVQLYVFKQPSGALRTLTGAKLPHGVEVLLAVGLERHQGSRVRHAGQAVQPAGYDISQVLDAADPDNSDDVGLASDGVRLGHSFYRGDLFRQLGYAGRFRIDEDKGCQHVPNRTAGVPTGAGSGPVRLPGRPLCWGRRRISRAGRNPRPRTLWPGDSPISSASAPRAMAHPPSPAPVSLAPVAPLASAVLTARSSSGQETSKSSRSEMCEPTSRSPIGALRRNRSDSFPDAFVLRHDVAGAFAQLTVELGLHLRQRGLAEGGEAEADGRRFAGVAAVGVSAAGIGVFDSGVQHDERADLEGDQFRIERQEVDKYAGAVLSLQSGELVQQTARRPCEGRLSLLSHSGYNSEREVCAAKVVDGHGDGDGEGGARRKTAPERHVRGDNHVETGEIEAGEIETGEIETEIEAGGAGEAHDPRHSERVAGPA